MKTRQSNTAGSAVLVSASSRQVSLRHFMLCMLALMLLCAATLLQRRRRDFQPTRMRRAR